MKPAGVPSNAKEPVTAWIRRTVAGVMIPVSVATVSGDPEETTHALRVASKQLRALLRLLRPSLTAEMFAAVDAQLKTAAGWLAAGRDDHVARQTLNSLCEGETRLALREEIAALAHQLDRVTEGTPEPGSLIGRVARARSELALSARLIEQANPGDAGWEELCQGLTETYRKARARMKKALPHGTADAFHRWRTPVKQLSCQLQWLEPVWPRRFSKMARLLHRLEQRLGEAHDLAILAERLLFPPGGFAEAAPASALKDAVDARTRSLRSRCHAAGKKVLRLQSKDFAKKCGAHWKRWILHS